MSLGQDKGLDQFSFFIEIMHEGMEMETDRRS